MIKIFIFGFPFLILWLFFEYYNFGRLSTPEVIKTLGLQAITLLSFSLLITPLSKLIPKLAVLKSATKTWGMASAISASIHFILVLSYRYDFNFNKLVNPKAEIYWGIIAGLISLAVLFYKLFIPIKNDTKQIPPNIWKHIITLTYLALILAFTHFYLVESSETGVLVIKKLAGRIAFGFAGITVLVRFILQLATYRNKSS